MEIKNCQWVLDKVSDNALDFEAIFEKHKTKNKLPELLGGIVKALEEVYFSNVIDGRAMSETLEKVITTIKTSCFLN